MERSPQTYPSRIRPHHRPQHLSDDRKQYAWRYCRHFQTSRSIANNPYVEGYDESQPTSYITYLDANNFYGYAQSEPLAVGDFRFLSEEEISKFDTKFLNSVPSDSSTGYILECDLSYPPELHDLHADYPMAPEHLEITETC